MSTRDSAPTAISLLRVLALVVVAGIVMSLALLAPLFRAERADAHSLQISRSETGFRTEAAITGRPPAAVRAGYVQRVWTSGFQAEIDKCRGAVDVTKVYRVRVIAEHSGCGGSRFPTRPGALVTLTGLDAGRYRVIGVVARLNGLVDHAEDLPGGYDLLFQTCVSGVTDMTFTALARIG